MCRQQQQPVPQRGRRGCYLSGRGCCASCPHPPTPHPTTATQHPTPLPPTPPHPTPPHPTPPHPTRNPHAGLQRQVVYGGLRIGLYEPIKKLYVGKDHPVGKDVGLGIKIAAGLTTGALGITVASPTDLVKAGPRGCCTSTLLSQCAACAGGVGSSAAAVAAIATVACVLVAASPMPPRTHRHARSPPPPPLPQVRMQAAGRLPDGHPRKYPSALAAYATIARTEGVAALWTGLGPNIARNAIINAAELASYDQIKSTLLSTGLMKVRGGC